MKVKKPKSIIVSDDSGHRYLIPQVCEEEFYKWVEAQEAGEEFAGEDFYYYSIDPARLVILDWENLDD